MCNGYFTFRLLLVYLGCTTPLLPFSDAVHQTILFEKKVNKLVYKILAKITSMRAKGPSASAQYISSKSQAPMLQ